MSIASHEAIAALSHSSLALIAGATAGAGSIPHCTLMCGPLSAYACREGGQSNSSLRYQSGRWLSYALLAIIALAGLVYGFVQHSLGRPPWALLAPPVTAAVFGFVYGATLIGQGLGAEQMYTLRSLVDRVSERALAPASPVRGGSG